ncbi:MAG: hypothetical protein ACPGVV_00585 [Croceimicrobium sp.]
MKLMQAIILSCREASTLIQKNEAGTLGLIEGVQLKLHLSICKLCRQYEKQSARLNEFLDQHFKQDKPRDNSAFKSKLKQEIRKK